MKPIMTDAESPQHTLTADQALQQAIAHHKPIMTDAESPQHTLTADQALQQAIAHHQAGRLQDAERLYRAILQAQPNHPDANHNLGVLAVQVKQPAAALLYFKAALEANPAQGQYWLSYIDALIQAGSTDAARQVLEQGRQRGLSGEAVEALAGKLEEPPGSEPGLQEMNALVALFNEGRHAEAATRARQMTARYPQHGFGWKVLGAVLTQMGRSADALDAMQKAAALSPDDAEAHYNLGIALGGLSRPAEAEASYRRTIEIRPNYAEAHSNLGTLLKGRCRLAEAEASYRRALEIRPDLAEVQNNLGNVLHDLGRLDEAEASFRCALRLKPDYAEAHSNLGIALHALGRLDEAEASYRRALQLKPDYAEAHSNLGNTLHELGRLEEAETSCRRALQLKPDYAEAHSNLGNTLRELERLEEAEASYRRAIEFKPDYADAHYNLGVVLQNEGRLEEAEAGYRRALEITSGSASNIYQLASYNYGLCLDKRGLYRESVFYCQQAFLARVGRPHLADRELSSGLVQAYIELTNKCNFHCDFCPSDFQQRKQSFMSLELIRQLYDEFAEKNLVKQVDLHLMGEPTLHPDLVEVLNYAASKNIKTVLVTNGSTLSIKTLPGILDALYGVLAVSLQTPTRESFKHRGDAGLSWDRYIENIRLSVREHLERIALKRVCRNTLELRVMVTMGSKLSANIVESLENIRDVLSEWYDFVFVMEIEFGLPPFKRMEMPTEMFAAPMSYPLQKGLKLEFWQGFTFANAMLSNEYRLERQNETVFCSRPFLDVAILASGDVTLCCLDYDGQLAVGNVKDNTIETILNGISTLDLRAAMLGRRPLPPFCQQCQAKAVPLSSKK